LKENNLEATESSSLRLLLVSLASLALLVPGRSFAWKDIKSEEQVGRCFDLRLRERPSQPGSDFRRMAVVVRNTCDFPIWAVYCYQFPYAEQKAKQGRTSNGEFCSLARDWPKASQNIPEFGGSVYPNGQTFNPRQEYSSYEVLYREGDVVKLLTTSVVACPNDWPRKRQAYVVNLQFDGIALTGECKSATQ
jgi:hypothetical protein